MQLVRAREAISDFVKPMDDRTRALMMGWWIDELIAIPMPFTWRPLSEWPKTGMPQPKQVAQLARDLRAEARMRLDLDAPPRPEPRKREPRTPEQLAEIDRMMARLRASKNLAVLMVG